MSKAILLSWVLPITIGLVVGACCFLVFGRGLPGVTTIGDPLQMNATFRPNWTTTWITIGISTAIVWTALKLPIDEFWIRCMLGLAAGFLVFGLFWQSTNRISITSDAFDVWTLNPFAPAHYRLGQGNQVFQEIESRPWSRAGNRVSIHYRYSDGRIVELCHDTSRNRIWVDATPHLIRHSKVQNMEFPKK